MAAAATANNAAATREPYPPPPSFFNLYGPDDGVSPLPPPPPPIPTPAVVEELREQKIDLKVLGNPLKLPHSEELVPKLGTSQIYRTRPDGTIDFKSEMRRLNGELMFMFLELTKTLAEQPSKYTSPLTQLNLLLSNLQHLTALMRPHQARATLEATLRLQVSAMREGLARLRGQIAAADATLVGMARALMEAEGDTAESAARPSSAAAAAAAAVVGAGLEGGEWGLCSCIAAIGLCASGCWPCACLPFCCNVTRDTVYRCTFCRAEVYRLRAPFE
ncbi:hypothetical protein GPECTOR_3g33 [Gonium pectorale]|uniref:Mediator of RNA polymerase II transcription subunit 7 n=1 Tax=Gonium pectorale TaxID=33097 RepID=A0A150GZH7_GONPE|nr:hypothetical protein GPECTOR_3g33 [Gonium pectorale]|eukprot:KXZ55184.1 hypothetical protein GPECTOR_3g33 [Gonium pectorale]